MTAITVDMLDAIKVQWLKPIFEDDFPERGMTAWLTAAEWEQDDEGYKLYFDFSEFEAVNAKYFREVYFPNRFSLALVSQCLLRWKLASTHQSTQSTLAVAT
jgi:hypothetical protein